ncbi:hypothetical protein JW711_06500 [Candidatus Woesearchaeota archaeon]|nr:hypothetical protein [Candidatus Woesearchaeota archaeon]
MRTQEELEAVVAGASAVKKALKEELEPRINKLGCTAYYGYINVSGPKRIGFKVTVQVPDYDRLIRELDSIIPQEFKGYVIRREYIPPVKKLA